MADISKMTSKQELILLFIYSDFANNQRKMIDVLERYNFAEKADLSENLRLLLDDGFIIVKGLAYNGTPFVYSTTEKGGQYVREELNEKGILVYVSKMDDPDFIYKITEVLIERKNKC